MPSTSSFEHLTKLPPGFHPTVLDDYPTTAQTAVVQTRDGMLHIDHATPLPTLTPESILVKVAAISINPCDWKMPSKFPAEGARVGCDFAGVVLAIGPEAARIRPDVRPGDRVCGGVHGNNPIDLESGSYAEYVAAHADLLFKLPAAMSMEAGAVLGGSVIATLQLALYNSLGLEYTLDRPFDATQGGTPPHVLVYGGSTSTGTSALQLLRMSGYKPIATCSPHNFGLVQAAGAEAVFDYHSPTCAQDIKTYTAGKLVAVLDVITDAASQRICHTAIGRTGGRYTCLEMPNPALHTRKNTVQMDMVVGLAASGKEIALAEGYERTADPQLRVDAARLFQLVQRKVDSGKFLPHPARVLGGSFQGMIDGIELLRGGGTSGEKLVVFV